MKNNMFKFERNNLDFPLYNNDSFLNLSNIIVILVAIILVSIHTFSDFSFMGDLSYLVDPVIAIVALAYITRRKFGLVYKKPVLNDIKVIVLSIILATIISMVVGVIVLYSGVHMSANSVVNSSFSIISTAFLFLQIFIEEIVRFLPFILVLTLVYKYSSNRKISVITALIISSLFFGFLHIPTYNSVFAILTIGLSSMAFSYAYIKTKNLLVSFIAHLGFDLLFIGLSFILRILASSLNPALLLI